MRLIGVFLFSLLGLSCYATTTTSMATCIFDGTAEAKTVSPSVCHQPEFVNGALEGGGSSSASAGSSLNASGQTLTFSIDGSTLATTTKTFGSAFALTETALSVGSESGEFVTAGPVRPGQLLIFLNNSSPIFTEIGGSFHVSYQIGSYSESCDQTTTASLQSCNMFGGFGIPFTLGTTFDFSELYSFSAFSSSNDGDGSSSGLLQGRVEFFDSATSSLVSVFETPEPRSFALLALGLAGLIGMLRAHR